MNAEEIIAAIKATTTKAELIAVVEMVQDLQERNELDVSDFFWSELAWMLAKQSFEIDPNSAPQRFLH